MSNNPLRAAAAWAARRYGRPSTAEPPDHNAARWLKIVPFRVVAAGPQSATRWWVLRTCPCHPGEPVAAPFATEAEALRCLHQLVSVSERLGT